MWLYCRGEQKSHTLRSSLTFSSRVQRENFADSWEQLKLRNERIGPGTKLNGISTSLVAFRLLQEPRILCVSLNEVFADQLRGVISRLPGLTFSHVPKMKNSDLRNSDGAVVAKVESDSTTSG